MPLSFRPARPSDYEKLECLVIQSFEPITWLKKVDERFGPFGLDWRQRWKRRFAHAFETQAVLIGEADGEIVAYASGTIDAEAKMGYIDLIAVDQRYQGRGYGRDMLRGMLGYMKEQGAVHAHLECLADNDVGNALYRSEGFVEVARSIRWFLKIP
jgi:ribosomal protein S18 acetylase RimI-like enzyme